VKRFWFLAPLLAAGWGYMVADEERFEMLQALGNQLLDAVPIESWLGA
jgi:hypothetical protein